MQQIELTVTESVPANVAAVLASDLRSVLAVSDPAVFRIRAATTPQWIHLLGDALSWTLPLKAAASVFLSQLAKNAADEVWKSRSLIVEALKEKSVSALKGVVEAFSRARRALPGSTAIVVGVPVPDGDFGTALSIQAADDADLAYALACFVIHAEAIETTMRKHVADGTGPIGPCNLELQPDGSFVARWMSKDLEQREQRIP